jgi:hypothetical protein
MAAGEMIGVNACENNEFSRKKYFAYPIFTSFFILDFCLPSLHCEGRQ